MRKCTGRVSLGKRTTTPSCTAGLADPDALLRSWLVGCGRDWGVGRRTVEQSEAKIQCRIKMQSWVTGLKDYYPSLCIPPVLKMLRFLKNLRFDVGAN